MKHFNVKLLSPNKETGEYTVQLWLVDSTKQLIESLKGFQIALYDDRDKLITTGSLGYITHVLEEIYKKQELVHHPQIKKLCEELNINTNVAINLYEKRDGIISILKAIK